MSFNGYHDVMKEGDVVILYLSKVNMLNICLKTGETYQTKYGCLRHNNLIGQKYGSKIQCAKGYIYALQPTPELWTVNLPHRTQILYSTDISMITLQLGLKPGSVVVESGTGSASLSHAIIRSIAPTGHLYTFEFHELRAKQAEDEFRQHGLSEFVTVKHRDVCTDGLGMEKRADAVFLDLPRPDDAVKHAMNTFKERGGRLCSFSPCIEQVQRVCLLLQQLSFAEIRTYECLIRNFEIRTLNLAMPDMGEVGYEQLCKDLPGVIQKAENSDSIVCKSAVAPREQPGHTGFLTFCTLYAKDQVETVTKEPESTSS